MKPNSQPTNKKLVETCPICYKEMQTLLYWWLNGAYVRIDSCDKQHMRVDSNILVNTKPAKILTPSDQGKPE